MDSKARQLGTAGNDRQKEVHVDEIALPRLHDAKMVRDIEEKKKLAKKGKFDNEKKKTNELPPETKHAFIKDLCFELFCENRMPVSVKRFKKRRGKSRFAIPIFVDWLS